MAKIDYKYEREFLSSNAVLIKNVNDIQKGDGSKPSEAFSGASADPTLVIGQKDVPENKNDLVSSVSELNHDDKKPVAGS